MSSIDWKGIQAPVCVLAQMMYHAGMNEPPGNENQSLRDQVVKLEELHAHQQHVVDQLSEMIRVMRSDMDAMRTTVDRLKHQVQFVQSSIPAEPRSLEDDKPPHY